MRKRVLTIVAVLAMAISPAMAQIYLLDDEDNRSVKLDEDGFGAIVPMQNEDDDQYYAPIGEGLTLLTAMGLAYWAGMRKKKD